LFTSDASVNDATIRCAVDDATIRCAVDDATIVPENAAALHTGRAN
jgi:hypothetical protein